MAGSENPNTSNTKFLTVAEEMTLRDQAGVFGQQCADAGALVVANNLEKLVDLAKIGRNTSFIPAVFITSASTRLWETGTEPDTIYTIYKKWFQTDSINSARIAESDTINEIQSTFVIVAGKFTTEEQDPIKQKQTLTKSLDFLDKTSANQKDKVEYIMHFAKYLFEHGMKKEGRKIAETTAKLAPKIVESLIDLKAILRQVSE